MAPHQFTIPPEFQGDLKYVEPRHARTDEEIISALNAFTPVESEKNIWAFWDSGIQSMPGWCKRNVANWSRLCGPSWTIRVLDAVPDSPNYALKYLPADMLPEAFTKGTMDGPYTGPHSADFLRGACLYLHGGVFMDVGILLVLDLDRVCWSTLADDSSPKNVAVPCMYDGVMANHFVASRKGDPFIKRWHDLFVHLWGNRTSHAGMASSPLLSYAAQLDLTAAAQNGYQFEFSVDAMTVLEYITQVLCWGRLCRLEDAGDGFSCADYAADNILWFDSLKEDWALETIVGFRGQNAFDALSTRLDVDPESEEYKTAYKAVWRVLTHSSMQKVSHAKKLSPSPGLGYLWDDKDGADCEPGTFGELLRYGSVYFEQTRESIAIVQLEKRKDTFRKGVFEP
ncbi:capsule polysaccharide biosynthesis protein [Blastomyces dermatitidis ER-3]|uniref:Capsule polysaccharide biosynthesis protein n=1 Tax=Ajellomyces dermatitidis (strain ER-3 / ATCC MYA-2586) TaxID=559297 RepID=A0ABP2ETN3_AJEDR|nr:capsule polysaccharide biosynthesis protein [Blastomyces dermatitidis ER-3]EEQ86131.1 capsule polysaccharide biosynthesis protein [Blastomyces dermatitidis ER-3]